MQTTSRGYGKFLAAAIFCAGTVASAQTKSNKPADSGLYEPMTARQRLHWVARSSLGPQSLATGIFTAGVGTARNSPEEYGPHWEGFGKRYGLRLANNGVTNTMEAGLGSLWGEDPRYVRCTDAEFGKRVKNVFRQTFSTRRPDGHFAPAYARFIAIPSSSFLSNTWRPDSKAHNDDAAIRIGTGFLGRMGGNAFREFWPDAKRLIFHRNH